MGFSMKETGQRRTKGARKVRTESAVDVEAVSGVVGEMKGCAQDRSFIFGIKPKNS
jgi:hypothetical protein